MCKYGHGCCTAPDTICPHWQGTFCELYDNYESYPVKEYCDRYSDYVKRW